MAPAGGEQELFRGMSRCQPTVIDPCICQSPPAARIPGISSCSVFSPRREGPAAYQLLQRRLEGRETGPGFNKTKRLQALSVPESFSCIRWDNLLRGGLMEPPQVPAASWRAGRGAGCSPPVTPTATKCHQMKYRGPGKCLPPPATHPEVIFCPGQAQRGAGHESRPKAWRRSADGQGQPAAGGGCGAAARPRNHLTGIPGMEGQRSSSGFQPRAQAGGFSFPSPPPEHGPVNTV